MPKQKEKDGGKNDSTRLSLVFFRGGKPPEIIEGYRVIDHILTSGADAWRQPGVTPAAAYDPVKCHHPAHDRPMFPDRLSSILGTGRVHGAAAAIRSGNVILIKPDDDVLFCGAPVFSRTRSRKTQHHGKADAQ